MKGKEEAKPRRIVRGLLAVVSILAAAALAGLAAAEDPMDIRCGQLGGESDPDPGPASPGLAGGDRRPADRRFAHVQQHVPLVRLPWDTGRAGFTTGKTFPAL
jgi:hypothetical protein